MADWVKIQSRVTSRQLGHLVTVKIASMYAGNGSVRSLRVTGANYKDHCLQEGDPRHPLHGTYNLKQDARTTLWVEEGNALGERLTECCDRGIIPNEHLASGTDEPWSTWRSLNRLRVQKRWGWAMIIIMKMWKLSHADVCDCGKRQTMSYFMTCGDARGQTWLCQPLPVSTVPNTGRNLYNSISRTRWRLQRVASYSQQGTLQSLSCTVDPRSSTQWLTGCVAPSGETTWKRHE